MTNSPFDPATTVIEDIAGDYTLDVAHTRLGFSARHAMVTTVRGAFKEFTGTAHVDTANPANSKVELTIKADSIDTGVADRDAHLRSADFFEIESHPEITFISTERRARRRRLDDHRRPDHQGRHQADHHRVRVHRLRPRPVRQPAHRLRGQAPPCPARTGA